MTGQLSDARTERHVPETDPEPRSKLRPPVITGIVLATVLTLVAGVALGMTLDPPRQGGGDEQPRAGSAGTTSTAPAPETGTRYERAVDAAARHGMRVWIETDLVKRWLSGPAAFSEGIRKVAALARRPGVVGINIADELGYHDGLSSADEVRAFLIATGAALAQAAPGKPLLVDILVPELGCMPNRKLRALWAAVCGVRQRGRYPQLTLAAVEGYLGLGVIDTLDLSTGLQPDRTYAGWGTDRDAAQLAAWREVTGRGWDRLTSLQARKALAHPDRYTGGTARASADLKTWVDIPLSSGARAVDIWAWRQSYKGKVNRLMDPGLEPNALWNGLLARRRAGAVLFTHFTPSSTEEGLDADLAVISKVFTDVFVAAGTG